MAPRSNDISGNDISGNDISGSDISGSDVISVLTRDHREVEQVFTRIEQLAPGDVRRKDLAERAVMTAKKVVPTRPHPAAPDRPPLNLMLGPAIGLVDRVRDLVSRRGWRWS